MNILYITDNFIPPYSGHAIAVINMAINIAKKKHNVEIIGPSPNIFKNYFGYINDIKGYSNNNEKIRVNYQQSLPFFKGDNILKSILISKKNIEKIIKRFRPDIIHYNGWGPICKKTYKIAVKNNIYKNIATCHGVPKHITSKIPLLSYNSILIENLIWKLMIHFYNKMDFIITPSKYIKEKLVNNGIKKDKVKFISNGIIVSHYKQYTGIKRNFIRKKYNISNKCFLVTYVGRLDPEKSLNIIVSIAKYYNKTNKNIFFLIAGTGSKEKYIKRKTKNLNNFKIIKWLNAKEVKEVLAISDVFINPSPSESQSIITLEAMASSLPLIVSNEGALKNLVKNRYNGIIFDNKNLKHCIHFINEIYMNKTLKNKFGYNSRKLVLSHNIKLSIKKLEQLYYLMVE